MPSRVTPMQECYQCTVQRRGRTAQIILAGELDLAAAPSLDAAIADALAGEGVDEVCLDLGLVAYADSTTIAWLVRAAVAIRAHDARMTLSDCSPQMRELLRMTGLDAHLALTYPCRAP